jgi:branched-chain amino acid transport system permease protein
VRPGGLLRRPDAAGLTDAGVLAALAVAAVAVPLVLPNRPPGGVYALGLVAGAGLALQAAGLILVYRSNRFVNFAQVAFGAVAATTFTTMVHARPLIRATQAVCPPCLERVTPAVRNANYALSFAAAVAVAGGLAWLSSRLVFRRFAQAPRLVLTVASIFLMQLLSAVDDAVPRLLASRSQREAALAVRAPAPLPFDVRLRIGGVVLHAGDMLLVVAAGAALAGLSVWLRRSGRGTAIRAASERPERAETLGVDVGGLDGRVWLLAGLLSGVAGVLTATTVGSGSGLGGVTPVALVVRILAVAVIARMTSLTIAGAAAVVLGIVDQAAALSFNTTDVLDAALLVVVAVVLLVQRERRTRADDDPSGTWRATREQRPIPAVLRDLPAVRAARRRAAGAVAVVMLGLPWALSSSQTGVASVVLLEAVAGLSLLVLTGWAGQVSLGQFAFAAVGAWAAASSRLPFPLAVVVGGGAGAAVAVAVGVPALRLRGLHLAITTLAFALATSAFLLNPRYLGRTLPASLDRPFDSRGSYYLALAALTAAVASVVSMRRSRTARALIAARDNPAAAQSFGIDVTTARLGAFAVSGFLAAAAGALIAFEEGGVRALAFTPERSLRLFAFAVIGGLGSVAGPLLGFGYDLVLSLFSASPLLVGLSTGAGGLALLLLLPGGLSQLFTTLRDAWLRRVARRHRIDVPGLLGRAASGAEGGPAPIAPPRPGSVVGRRYDLDDQWAIHG